MIMQKFDDFFGLSWEEVLKIVKKFVGKQKLKSREEFDDVVQECLLILLSHCKYINDAKTRDHPKDIVYIILKQKIGRAVKKMIRDSNLIDLDNTDATYTTDDFNLLIDLFNENERKYIALKVFHGLSDDEIAEELCISRPTVVSIRDRIRKKLENIYDKK